MYRVEEVAAPYFLWKMHGFEVEIGSVQGGEIPWDPASMTGDFLTSDAKAFLENEESSNATKNTKSISEILKGNPETEFDAIFIPGGHGIVFDGPENTELKELLERFWNAGKVVSSVCHGPAGLISACTESGDPIVKGRKVCAFTDDEERAVGKDKVVPFLLESRLKEMGAEFIKSSVGNWNPMVAEDGKLITGQNPQSSAQVAEAVTRAVAPHISEPVHGKGEGFHARGHAYSKEHHHDHWDSHPAPHGARADVSTHPSAHHSQYNVPLRQTTHTDTGTRHGRPDKSYTG